MNSKKKIMVSILGIEALAIVALIIFLFYINSDTVRVKRQLELAQHYLIEEDYEQAIAVFNTIIEINPKNEDAYIGLAQAYAESGNLEEAVKTLEKGYKETNAEGIYELKVIQTEELAKIEAQKQEEAVLTTDIESRTESIEIETVDMASSENISQTEEITSIQTGFVTQDGELYYYDEQGNMVTGWFDVNSNRYCARQDGKLYKGGKYEVDGTHYLFGQDGLCLGEMNDDVWKQAYINKVREFEAEDYQYGGYELINLDNDDIPELVIDKDSHIGLYTFDEGALHTIMDYEEWSYGTYSRYYSYAVNLIIHNGTIDAGRGRWVDYYKYNGRNSQYQLEFLYSLSCEYAYIDENGNGYYDWGEETILEDELIFQYNDGNGDKEITEEEYDRLSNISVGNSQDLYGTLSSNEIIDKITNW